MTKFAIVFLDFCILVVLALSLISCDERESPPPGPDSTFVAPDSLIHVDFPGNSDGHGNADSAHAAHKKDK